MSGASVAPSWADNNTTISATAGTWRRLRLLSPRHGLPGRWHSRRGSRRVLKVSFDETCMDRDRAIFDPAHASPRRRTVLVALLAVTLGLSASAALASGGGSGSGGGGSGGGGSGGSGSGGSGSGGSGSSGSGSGGSGSSGPGGGGGSSGSGSGGNSGPGGGGSGSGSGSGQGAGPGSGPGGSPGGGPSGIGDVSPIARDLTPKEEAELIARRWADPPASPPQK